MFVIDRFEGDLAVCEDDGGSMVSLPRSALPADAKEGDMIKGSDGVFVIDRDKTHKTRETLFSRLRSLAGK